MQPGQRKRRRQRQQRSHSLQLLSPYWAVQLRGTADAAKAETKLRSFWTKQWSKTFKLGLNN